MILALSFLLLLPLIGYLFMQQKVFGKKPSGERLERIRRSTNYVNGSFQNILPTEVMLPNASYVGMMKEFFNKPKSVNPASKLPTVSTDLKAISGEKTSIVWFGHSSYLIRSKSLSILVDPVFSGNAAPVSFFAKAFKGTDVYSVNDFPPLDIVVLTHDHYDHLDYKTILALKSSVGLFITSLGVGAHLEHWGVEKSKIVELDWWESHQISEDLIFVATPARHFSGRGFQRAKALWSSFVLKIHSQSIFLGGDSGYDDQFKAIGEKYGPFDIALLEAGQYGKNWPNIHMLPEETVLAATELKAKVLFPVHWSKFALAMHDWNEPINRVAKKASELGLEIRTPKIGQKMEINDRAENSLWWNF